MTEERAKRKLSAILSADVKGYSRLMGEDELGTVRILEAYREMIAEVIRNYRGRVVDSPGDNLEEQVEADKEDDDDERSTAHKHCGLKEEYR